MDFRILGPLDVRDGGRPLALGGEKQRAVLAVLLLHRNEVVSVDRLIDELWGESPPAGARQTLRAYVSKLRRAMGSNGAASAVGGDSARKPGDGVLLTRGHGYLLEIAPGELDLDRFAETAERGRDALAAGRPEDAARLLREALSVWRGPALAEFSYERFAQTEIAQLEELRLGAVEDCVEAELALGHARELVAELRNLVTQHPLRERLRGQLMLALYRSGRQAEALEVYREFRRMLSEQLGLEPGRALQQLELAMLGHDQILDFRASPGVPELPAASSFTAQPTAGLGRRRRLALVMGGPVLLALVLIGVSVAPNGGGTPVPAAVPGNSVGAIGPSGGAVRAVVPLGTSPSALAAGDGALWVANYNAGTVSRIDPSTRAVVQTIQVGTPSGVAVAASAVWVTNNYGQTVSRIDPAVDRVVQRIPVGNAPSGVAAGDGSVWVANGSDGTLSRIDTVTGALRDTVMLGGNPTGVAVGAGGVWASDEAGRRVLRVDPRSDQVTASIEVGTGPTAIAVGFGSVWVANSLDGTVSRIDPQTNTVTATITAGDGAGAIAVGGQAVWVSNQYAGTVSRLDPFTDTVARTISVGNRPQGLAIAGGLVWVGDRAAGTNHRGGTLTILTTSWADTLDPVLATAAAGVLQQTNDGLTAYQHAGGAGSVQVVPDLAVSLPSPTDSGTTYTFQLRRGIRFSSGEMVRPEDFRRALERDLILGPNSEIGGPFARVVGGAACAAHPRRCDLSRGVVTDDAANTVTFHLVAPNPEFLERLTLWDAVAVPAGTPFHDIGLRGVAATGPYEVASLTHNVGTLVRNPYFHEWSHAARPDSYPNRIVYRLIASQAAELAAIERGTADYGFDGLPPNSLSTVQTRFASRLYEHPLVGTDALVLNTRVAPFNDVRVRQAINFAIDRRKIASLLGEDAQPTCQLLAPYVPGYRRYCPYTLDPNLAGVWHAPDLAKAKRLIAASHTRGIPITIWNLGAYQTDYRTIEPYLVSLLDRLGYPTQIKDVSSTDYNASLRVADSRTKSQATLSSFSGAYLSASRTIQLNFACGSLVPNSTGNPNISEFCDHNLDVEINAALAAEGNNSPHVAALWARADRTITDEAALVPLATPTVFDFVSSRVGNYQYSYQQGMLIDQVWVR